MSSRRVLIALAALVALAGCGAVDGSMEGEGDEVPASWTLAIATEGGITGGGVGAIRLDSDGSAEVTTMAGSCTRPATAQEIGAVNAALSAAKPAEWLPRYAARGADLITYRMNVELGVSSHEVVWQDGSKLPSDLAELTDRLWRIHSRIATGGCGS